MTSEREIDDLLASIGLSVENAEAYRHLRIAFSACSPTAGTVSDPGKADHDDKLEEIARLADDLVERLESLRNPVHSRTHSDFWVNPELGPIQPSKGDITSLERDHVFSTLSAISTAAISGKWNYRGRPPKHRKQAIVDVAMNFYIRFVDQSPTTTATGRFGKFAHAFHAAVTGSDEGVDAQVKKAVERLPVVLERINQDKR